MQDLHTADLTEQLADVADSQPAGPQVLDAELLQHIGGGVTQLPGSGW